MKSPKRQNKITSQGVRDLNSKHTNGHRAVSTLCFPHLMGAVFLVGRRYFSVHDGDEREVYGRKCLKCGSVVEDKS